MQLQEVTLMKTDMKQLDNLTVKKAHAIKAIHETRKIEKPEQIQLTQTNNIFLRSLCP